MLNGLKILLNEDSDEKAIFGMLNNNNNHKVD